MKNRRKVRTIFVSDLHLGSRYSRADDFLEYIKSVDCECLYLVGDIIDGWKLKNKLLWTQTYNLILRRIIGMSKNGTKIFYVLGNHDEFLKQYGPIQIGDITLCTQAYHTSLKNEKILVIHGDIFDSITSKLKHLYFIGDKFYSFSMFLNEQYNYIRRKLGLSYWSLSLMLKRNVKKAVNFINKFEEYMVEYTKEQNCQSIVCGHIHNPVIKNINGINYYNCGDWVESCTALEEDYEGNISLLEFHSEKNICE